MPDFFTSKLREATFRDISFPVSSFQLGFSQDIAQHKRPDQDGAFIEATGRNPLTFQATIPFVFGLAKGSNETWKNLYPEQHAKFLAAMADRRKGKLVHPSFGEVIVKPVSCQSTLTPERRNGETVSADWIEANETEEDSDNLFGRKLFAEGSANALALDELLSNRPLIKKADPDPRISLSEAFNRLVAVFDTASLLVRRGLAEIDRLAYRLDTLHRAVSSLADPKNWDVRQRISRLVQSVEKIRRLGMGNGQISFYIVPKTKTVAQLATDLGTSTRELIELNPFLSSRLVVERGEAVRRFKRS